MIKRVNADKYKAVLSTLGFSERLINIASGELKLPENNEIPLQPARSDHSFPPAYIPLWSEWSSYTSIGIWKHWFVEREPTFVALNAEGSFSVGERARTEEQLMTLILFEDIAFNDEVRAEAERFASEVGIEFVTEIKDAAFRSNGGLMEALISLPGFSNNAPLDCYTNQFGFHRPDIGDKNDGIGYTGDFPNANMQLLNNNFRMCTIETSERLYNRVIAQNKTPEWFTAKKQLPVFNTLLAANDLKGAWMSLNSSGWTFSEARDALQRLITHAEDQEFSLVADAWLHEAEAWMGQY